MGAAREEREGRIGGAGPRRFRFKQGERPEPRTARGVANEDAVEVDSSGGQPLVDRGVLQHGGSLPDGRGQPVENDGGVGKAGTASARNLRGISNNELSGRIGFVDVKQFLSRGPGSIEYPLRPACWIRCCWGVARQPACWLALDTIRSPPLVVRLGFGQRWERLHKSRFEGGKKRVPSTLRFAILTERNNGGIAVAILGKWRVGACRTRARLSGTRGFECCKAVKIHHGNSDIIQ